MRLSSLIAYPSGLRSAKDYGPDGAQTGPSSAASLSAILCPLLRLPVGAETHVTDDAANAKIWHWVKRAGAFANKRTDGRTHSAA
jgi:hypothetical protein